MKPLLAASLLALGLLGAAQPGLLLPALGVAAVLAGGRLGLGWGPAVLLAVCLASFRATAIGGGPLRGVLLPATGVVCLGLLLVLVVARNPGLGRRIEQGIGGP